jgi:hypothetical protein
MTVGMRRTLSTATTAAVLALTGLLVARRIDYTEPALAAGAAVIAYCLLGAYVLPWYVFWGLPALVLAWRSRLTWLALLHGAVLHVAYLPDPTLPHPPDRLYLLTPMQRFQGDLYQVWVPLLEVCIIVAVVIASLPWPRRAPSEL